MHVKGEKFEIHQKMNMIWTCENKVHFKTFKSSYLLSGLSFYNNFFASMSFLL